MKHINLNALEQLRHSVEKDGVTYPVRPITPRVAYIIRDAEAATDPEAKMRAWYDAVARLVPTMPRDEVDDLSPAQCWSIISLSKEQVEIVEEAAADPNPAGSAPTPATEPAPAAAAT